MEIDFPRQDVSVSKKRRAIRPNNDETTDVKQSSIKNEHKSEYDGVWDQRITPNFLTEGMLGLGVVKKIKEAEILLECSDGIIVKVPIQNFGSLMLETFKNSSLTLEDVFREGQMLAFKITKAREIRETQKKGKKASYPIVSCDPLIVNFHLDPGTLVNGLVLNGIVESIEDKGVIINLGLQSVELKGFLAEKYLPSTFEKESLVPGQPLLLRIQNENSSNKIARVISLSAAPEMECLDDAAVKKLKLNDLMPGTLLTVNPLQPTASGVYVNIGNDIKGYVSRRHLPPRYRDDPFKCLKSFRTIVMFCQQNSKLLVLNGHPDIIAASKFVKRVNFENIHIGDIIECKVSSVDRNGNVNFDMLYEDERNSLLAAFAKKAELEDHVEYKKGTIHQARVLSFKMVERILIVATRKDILAQKIVSVKDAIPGEKVIAKVKCVLAKGLFVKIYDSIPGFIPQIHLSDKLITQIDKHFAIGDELKCRILTVNKLKEQLILTNKRSLITNKDTVIKSYAEVTNNTISTGYIISQHPSGGLIIGFYGGTRGFMFPKEAERLGTNVKVGLTVRVRVISVDPQRERMLVVIANTTNDGTGIARAQPFAINGDSPASFSAVVVNVSSNGDKLKHEVLNVSVQLGMKLGGKVKAFISKELLTDYLDLPFSSLSESIALGSVLPKVAVLGDVAGNLKATSKLFMINWLENHPRITGIQNLAKGELVCGHIIQKHQEMGYFVELAGGSALTAPARFIRPMALSMSMQELQIGQTVVARVSSVNLERKRFALILDTHLCVPPDAERDYFAPSMVRWFLEELNWFIINNPNRSQVPKIGECIHVKVIEVSKCSIIVCYADNSRLKGQVVNRTDILQKGSYAKALVLDVKLPACELVLFLLNDDVQHLNEKKLQSLLCNKKEFNAMIWLRKREYAVATVETEKSAFVVCIPLRIHPNMNIVLAKLDENDNQWTIIPKLVTGNVMIGTAMETLKKYGLIHRRFKIPVKPAVKKKLKQFVVYTAKVMGMWSRGDLYNAVELELPDGSIGRLHASEFDEDFLNQTSLPVQSFLKKRKGKTVNVKIMSFTKLKQKVEKLDLSKPKGKGIQKGKKMVVVIRLAECTMKTWKLSETKRKQSLIGYPQSYAHGSLIPVFVCKGPHVGVVKVEVSPLWNGIIRKQNLYDENLMTNPINNTSALVDIDFEPGEKLIAQVIGVNVYKNSGKSRHRKCLEMTLKEARKTFERGDRVTGRVVGITQSPSSIILELTNNQRALLTLTGITDDYLKAHEAIKSYELNQIYNVQLLCFDSNKGKWLAVTESRYNFSKESDNALYLNGSDVKIGSKLQAFVTSAAEDAQIFVEISPGITGCVTKYRKLSLKPDDLIRVCVNYVFPDGGLKVEFVDLIAEGSAEEKPRKRLISIGSGSDIAVDSPRKKSRAAGYVAAHSKENKSPQLTSIEAKLPEPGLDWSLKGFTPAEFATVGQLEKVDVPLGTLTAEDESTIHNIEELNKPKGMGILKKMLIEEEKKLASRERKILETNWIPDNTNDFDRLVAGTPNSSILWIRYITFFLERNNVEKARAVAERALSVINFREEDEIFNIWTAYLNLEGNFGTNESLKAVFENAIKNTDALKMYKQMVKIYQNLEKTQEADDLLDEMLKRFRHDDLDVWFIYGQHLLETKRPDKARNLMKKAVNCLPRKYHVTILSRFAQLEFKFGDMEQSKTIFENILNSYPKRTDVWTVYVDLLIKAEKIENARQLLERVTALKLSTHKIRLFFKKWIDLEQRHGDEKQQNNVCFV
uniref:S1 motif domain-containing protein n=1 Tax=Elaeophora elaphi TaxID=1147741 RepID=A0A0R3RVQ9_9BILA